MAASDDFWRLVSETAKKVDAWPEWKKNGSALAENPHYSVWRYVPLASGVGHRHVFAARRATLKEAKDYAIGNSQRTGCPLESYYLKTLTSVYPGIEYRPLFGRSEEGWDGGRLSKLLG